MLPTLIFGRWFFVFACGTLLATYTFHAILRLTIRAIIYMVILYNGIDIAISKRHAKDFFLLLMYAQRARVAKNMPKFNSVDIVIGFPSLKVKIRKM